MVRKARRSAKRKEKSSPRLRSDVAGVEELRRLGVEAPTVSRLDLRELILSAGIASLQQMMQEELEALCGSRYARKDGDEVASRWGSQGSIVVLGVVSRNRRKFRYPPDSPVSPWMLGPRVVVKHMFGDSLDGAARIASYSAPERTENPVVHPWHTENRAYRFSDYQ